MVLDSSSPTPVKQTGKTRKRVERIAVWAGFVITSAILINGMVLLVLMVPEEQTANRIWATAGVSFLTVFALGVNFLLWKLMSELWAD